MDNSHKNHLHIVSFDVPFPANYGGVIDVFHKIRVLKQAGINITLHCFEYGRGKQPLLEALCHNVYYYRRNTGPIANLSLRPYVVTSRRHPDLLKNLLNDEAPILFEGLHTCELMKHPLLKKRLKIYRESNIEHHYYYNLAKAESNLHKKLFFIIEAIRLRLFQKILNHANLMLTVSEDDNQYLLQHFPGKKIAYLPSFHAHDNVSSIPGKGNYALYQGKLSVAENHLAAKYLIEKVFAGTEIPFIVAGMDPDKTLTDLAARHPNITLIANPGQEAMDKLTAEAQVNVMITFQATGLKLKLINTLYAGRHCLANSLMLAGTNLKELCVIADDADTMKNTLSRLMALPFDESQTNIRRERLKPFDNPVKLHQLLEFTGLQAAPEQEAPTNYS